MPQSRVSSAVLFLPRSPAEIAQLSGGAALGQPIHIRMIRFGYVCEYPLRNGQALASDLYLALSFARIAANQLLSYQLAPGLRRSVVDSTRAEVAVPETAGA
jgi:hypothetical protein